VLYTNLILKLTAHQAGYVPLQAIKRYQAIQNIFEYRACGWEMGQR